MFHRNNRSLQTAEKDRKVQGEAGGCESERGERGHLKEERTLPSVHTLIFCPPSKEAEDLKSGEKKSDRYQDCAFVQPKDVASIR